MAPISGEEKIKQQSQEELARIARICMDIRQAVRDALPAPAEQFFTLMVPGKVVNLEDFTGGFDAKGKATAPVLPNSVQLAEAILCDDMPALSGVQLGPTGRSVARSYDATLSKLCPAGSTVGIDDDTDGGELTEAEKRYRKAMTWLTSEDPIHPGKTRIDTYREKQAAYTEAYERKTKAFNNALEMATKDPLNTTVALQRAAYDEWVSENQKTYRNLVQAAYMDWVTIGKKEEAEYWFAVVDNDSAMSRVEASKEAMRAAVISDVDGSAEYQKVQLSPSNWAWLAAKKAAAGPTGDTVETLTWKISRLQKINMVLEGMKTDPGKLIPVVPGEVNVPKPENDPVIGFLEANASYKTAYVAYEKLKEQKKDKPDDQKALEEKFKAMNQARGNLTQYFADVDKANLTKLNAHAQQALTELFADGAAGIQRQIDANKALADKYQQQLDKLQQGKASATDVQNTFATETGIPPASPDPPADPKPFEPDFWTTISVEVSSSYGAEQTDSSSTSFSVGGGFSFGLFSIGGNVSHASVSTRAAKQMANSSIKATFDCMRVDITRSWLRGELFYDDELRVAPNNFISPGPVTLAALMDPETHFVSDQVAQLNKEQELQKYDMFPMYPTSFLLAANVILEVEGETADILAHFSSSTTSGSASVGWGPFAVSTSFSHTSTHADSTCEATASGCRITIRSPQIIGWISQLVPAMPRQSQTAPQ